MNDQNIERLKQMQLDYQAIFASENGKRVLQDLENICFERRVTFNENERIHAFQDGQRAVLLHIKTMLSLNIEQMEKTIKERAEDNG